MTNGRDGERKNATPAIFIMSWRDHVKSSSNRAVHENAAENLAITKRNITKRTNNDPLLFPLLLFPFLCRLFIVDRVYEIFQSRHGPSSFSSRLCKSKGISYSSNKGNQQRREASSSLYQRVCSINPANRFPTTFPPRALRLDQRSHFLWPFDSIHANHLIPSSKYGITTK